MKTISIRDFRRNAERVLTRVRNGERLILTHRGEPVARLEPVGDGPLDEDDPFYSVCELAEPAGALSNRQIDHIVYGE
jgi:prevent-host-death family protein